MPLNSLQVINCAQLYDEMYFLMINTDYTVCCLSFHCLINFTGVQAMEGQGQLHAAAVAHAGQEGGMQHHLQETGGYSW